MISGRILGRAVAGQPGADLLPVQQQESLGVPLRAVGQLSNGCTGYLIGPCHVMTVAHCVYEPWRGTWWQGLDFHPGRNLAAKDLAESPLGSAAKADVRLHPNWASTAAAPASDAAIIITSTPIGREVGWFSHKPPPHVTRQQEPQPQQQELEVVVPSAQDLGALVTQQQLSLHIAGYPDNRSNGSMWQQCCSALDWQLQGNLLWHDCYARGGNSGSPVWVVWPKQQQGNSNSSNKSSSWHQFHAVGVHPSSLKFPSDSQMGVYADGLYAQSIARAQQRQAAAAAGQAAAQCTAATSSLAAAAALEANITAADASRAAPAAARAQATGPSAAAAAEPAVPGVSVAPAAPAAGPVRLVATGRRRQRRALLAGAGGREEEGLTLLPVAVPFTGDMYAWVEQVLKEFAQCPGE